MKDGVVAAEKEVEELNEMEPSERQALRLVEDLTLPSVQVVVMSANMGCSHCRKRVHDVVSKMNGLTDFVVDVGKKEVTLRSIADMKRRKMKNKPSRRINLTSVFALLIPICCISPTHVTRTKI